MRVLRTTPAPPAAAAPPLPLTLSVRAETAFARPYESFANVELRPMYERAATACAGSGARKLILSSRQYELVTPFAMAEWRGVALVNRQMHASVLRCLAETRDMAAAARHANSSVDLSSPAWQEVSGRLSPVENMLRMLCIAFTTSRDLMAHRASARWLTRLGNEPGEVEALYFSEPMEGGRLLLEMANRAELALMQARFDTVDRYFDAAEAVALAAAACLACAASAFELRLGWLGEVSLLGAQAAQPADAAPGLPFAEMESVSSRTAVVNWESVAVSVDVLASGTVVALPPNLIVKQPLMSSLLL